MLNPCRVLSKSQILQNVWRYDFGGNSNVVETYVSYLRKKLDAAGPPLIRTIRQAGYMLESPEAMVSRLSLRARLVLGVIVLGAVGLAVANVATYASLRSFLLDRTDASLEESGTGGRARPPPRQVRRPRRRPPPGLEPRRLRRVRDDRRRGPLQLPGRVERESAPSPPELPDDLERRVRLLDGLPRRRAATPLPRADDDRAGRGRSSSRRRSTTSTRRSAGCSLIELLVTLAVLGALAALGLWVVRLGLRPLDDDRDDRCRDRRRRSLQRVERAEPNTEVGRLGSR